MLKRLLFVLFLLPGCAYHWGYGERGLPGGYDLLSIPVFNNKTSETGAEVYFTKAMMREIERSRVARLVKKDEAQVTLEGSIDEIRYERSSVETKLEGLPENTGISRTYRIVAFASLVLRRNSDQKIVWQSQFRNEISYAAPQLLYPVVNSANPLYNHSARHENLSKIAEAMMAEAHSRIVEKF